MKHAILALERAGFGEPAVARLLAHQLEARGQTVRLVIDRAAAPVFAGSGLQVDVLPDAGPCEPVILEAVRGSGTVVLADYVSAMNALQRRAVDPRLLHGLDAQFLFVDTWHAAEVGGVLDVGLEGDFTYAPGFATLPNRLVPVPFVRPEVAGGFSILPAAPVPDPRYRAGLPDDARLVLLATSRWHHERAQNPRVEDLRAALPALLDHQLAQLDPRVHLVHVGPGALGLPGLGDRTHRLPPLPAADFGRLLASVDAVLSLNLPATTNTLAVAAGVPVITLENPWAGDVDQVAQQLGAPLQPFVRDWIAARGSLYPFVMCPLAMGATLEPVFADNPYAALLHRTPLLHTAGVLDTVHGLLFDAPRRQRLQQAMQRYSATLAALPTGAERILAYCSP